MSLITGMGWPLLGIVYGGQTNTFMDAQMSYDANQFFKFDHGITETPLPGLNISIPNPPSGNYSTPDVFLDGVIQAAVRYSLVGTMVFIGGYIEVIRLTYANTVTIQNNRF